jgi:DNA modification methylase
MLPGFETEKSISSEYVKDTDVILHQGDASEFVATIPAKSVQLVITSPPYNIGKEYETRTSIETYLDKQRELITELHRVLDNSGSICWQVGNFVDKGEVYPLDIFYYGIFKGLGFHLRNRIIWRFGHGLHASKRFSGRYETILWFSKTDRYVFNLDPVRVPSKYPGKRHFKGPNRGKPSGNPLGKNPSDIWDVLAQDWEKEIWDIPNVKSNHPEKTLHPCQYPIELVERCVLAMTHEGDTVFDPFAGVGSSLIAAVIHERPAIGCEKEAEYIDIAHDRIQQWLNGTLRHRPIGMPIHKPRVVKKSHKSRMNGYFRMMM